MEALYDRIGIDYSALRCTDPRIASPLYAELGGATSVVNIGAGTGSYEPAHLKLVAVEPSCEMIAQRDNNAHPVKQAYAEHLPFPDKAFSHAMTVLSMHHWEDRALAYSEISRVTTNKFVALTWVPDSGPFWLTRDYFPEFYASDTKVFPDCSELSEYFDDVKLIPLAIPEDCKDGFLAAYWKRPEAYLSEQVRQSISSFSKIDDPSAALERLRDDLATGRWEDTNQDILNRTSLDCGYRIITANIRK